MCISPVAAESTDTRNSCRWLTADAADVIRRGDVAFLRICKMRTHQPTRHAPYTLVPHVQIYMVQYDFADREWVMTHDCEGSGSGEGFTCYRLSRDLFDCSCSAAQHVASRGCKHQLSLAAALKHIGISPMFGK